MSGLKIVSADQRMAEQDGIKGVIFGAAKVGKTSLLWTLDPASTLFVDLEAGGLSVQGWGGDSIEVRDWDSARNLACFLGGSNPARRADQPYSRAHYDYVCGLYGDPATTAKYSTIFVDSITVASRLALQWAKGQPEASSERTGKPDTRGAYGLLGQEMIGWVTPLQHIGSRNVWFVGLLDEKRDDFPPLLRAADRREQDRLGTARHCGRGCHHDRAEAGRRKRTAVPRCCLLTAQSLGLSGRGPRRQT